MRKFLLLVLATGTFSCSQSPSETSTTESEAQLQAQHFIDDYTQQFKKLYYESAEAEWASNTRIIPGDTTNAWKVQQANEAYARFTGSSENIEKARELLEQEALLRPIQVKQLQTILYTAANNPATVEDLVKERIKAEAQQTELLFGYDFKVDNKSVSTNDIDNILKGTMNLDSRQNAWAASKEVGTGLREGLLNLRRLRNETVEALGYDNYFAYQVSDYGMTSDEMMALNQQLIRDIWPLYRELHTYARYELAKRYGVQEVPAMLPAHWLPNRWGQDWSPMVEVEGINLDPVLEEKGPEWLVQQAERFYISLGFQPLPQSFWEKSSLYPAPADATYKKNNHASAWHMDLEEDVRALQSVIPNEEWYETTHHELGHIYYYISYTNPDVPPLLRGGANRAFHEAVGSMMGLAAMQKPFIAGLGLIDPNTKTDETQSLLKEALNYIVFIPFSAGVMTHFEHDLYANDLPADQLNKRWWELAEKYQGMVPPAVRGEEYTDAASKTHINNDAAQYYDYAISYALLFQLHDHVARNILNQDPRSTNYYGNEKVGDFLKDLLRPGATRDWRELLRETTGEDLSAKAMLSYFEPLMAYLKEVNRGRTHTLPETI
ncbi:M2 family metallopeptidase [Cesiribacter sp. SM1]|uniref:M2 family metallopeptidase n=1 Tax=Cesiribacter sp. SM1 TaxID=2861196 RepID=UPI001CD3A360|nr:M2 family metallopeptidase [Cesiribacter sp. SM1]